MALNKREKIVAWTLGAALVLWLGDSQIVEPYLQSKADMQSSQEIADKDLATAKGLLDNRVRVDAAWKQLTSAGLKTTAADAELNSLHAITDWAQAARVTIETHKTDVPTQEPDFQKVRINVAASGTMAELSRFLYDIETGTLPLQLGDIHISSHKDGTDDLGLQFTVTTLVFSPQVATTKPKKPVANGDNL